MSDYLNARDLELIEIALDCAALACDSPLTEPLAAEYRAVADKIATILPPEDNQ